MDKIDYFLIDFFIDKIHESPIIDQRLIYLFFLGVLTTMWFLES